MVTAGIETIHYAPDRLYSFLCTTQYTKMTLLHRSDRTLGPTCE